MTGAGSGLGRDIARLFAAEGCRVVATDQHEAPLTELVAQVRSEGKEMMYITGNVVHQEDVDRMVAAAIGWTGRLDILVNNAGIMDAFDPVGDLTDTMWEKVMSVNVTGPMRLMRKAVNAMLTSGGGSIVNVASIGGLRGGRAGAAYTSSKHALIGLTMSTGYMYAKQGIRCNAIAAGAMSTSIMEGFDFSKLSPLVQERIMAPAATNPRSSDPVEVARLALFLASDEASFVNGATIVADGGWIAY